MKYYFVYVMASASGVLYVGVTNNLIRRCGQHRRGEIRGFTSRYKVTRLVYYETFSQIHAAIQREKQLKRWNREKKVQLIQEKNPLWRDLWGALVGRA